MDADGGGGAGLVDLDTRRTTCEVASQAITASGSFAAAVLLDRHERTYAMTKAAPISMATGMRT